MEVDVYIICVFVSKLETLKESPWWIFYLLLFTELVGHNVKRPILSTRDSDMVILKSLYIDQGDPIQCWFRKTA